MDPPSPLQPRSPWSDERQSFPDWMRNDISRLSALADLVEREYARHRNGTSTTSSSEDAGEEEEDEFELPLPDIIKKRAASEEEEEEVDAWIRTPVSEERHASFGPARGARAASTAATTPWNYVDPEFTTDLSFLPIPDWVRLLDDNDDAADHATTTGGAPHAPQQSADVDASARVIDSAAPFLWPDMYGNGPPAAVRLSPGAPPPPLSLSSPKGREPWAREVARKAASLALIPGPAPLRMLSDIRGAMVDMFVGESAVLLEEGCRVPRNGGFVRMDWMSMHLDRALLSAIREDFFSGHLEDPVQGPRVRDFFQRLAQRVDQAVRAFSADGTVADHATERAVICHEIGFANCVHNVIEAEVRRLWERDRPLFSIIRDTVYPRNALAEGRTVDGGTLSLPLFSRADPGLVRQPAANYDADAAHHTEDARFVGEHGSAGGGDLDIPSDDDEEEAADWDARSDAVFAAQRARVSTAIIDARGNRGDMNPLRRRRRDKKRRQSPQPDGAREGEEDAYARLRGDAMDVAANVSYVYYAAWLALFRSVCGINRVREGGTLRWATDNQFVAINLRTVLHSDRFLGQDVMRLVIIDRTLQIGSGALDDASKSVWNGIASIMRYIYDTVGDQVVLAGRPRGTDAPPAIVGRGGSVRGVTDLAEESERRGDGALPILDRLRASGTLGVALDFSERPYRAAYDALVVLGDQLAAMRDTASWADSGVEFATHSHAMLLSGVRIAMESEARSVHAPLGYKDDVGAAPPSPEVAQQVPAAMFISPTDVLPRGMLAPFDRVPPTEYDFPYEATRTQAPNYRGPRGHAETLEANRVACARALAALYNRLYGRALWNMMRVESVSSVFAAPVVSFLVGRSNGDRLYAGRDQKIGRERFALFSCVVSLWEAATGETATILNGLRRASRRAPRHLVKEVLRERAARLVRDTWDDTLGMTTLVRLYKWHERTAEDEHYRDDSVAEIVAEIASAFHEGRPLGDTRFNMLHQWLASARDNVFRSVDLLDKDIDYDHMYDKLGDILVGIEGIHLSDGVFGSLEQVQRAFGISITVHPHPLSSPEEEEERVGPSYPQHDSGSSRKRKEVGRKIPPPPGDDPAPPEDDPSVPPSTVVMSGRQNPPPGGLIFPRHGQR